MPCMSACSRSNLLISLTMQSVRGMIAVSEQKASSANRGILSRIGTAETGWKRRVSSPIRSYA